MRLEYRLCDFCGQAHHFHQGQKPTWRWLTDDPTLAAIAREAIANESYTIPVSAASAKEIATKHR